MKITIVQTDAEGLAFKLSIGDLNLNLNPGAAMAIAQAIEEVVSGNEPEIMLEFPDE